MQQLQSTARQPGPPLDVSQSRERALAEQANGGDHRFLLYQHYLMMWSLFSTFGSFAPYAALHVPYFA